MPLRWILSLAFLPLCGCAHLRTTIVERPDWKTRYDRAEVHGCFLLYDMRGDRMQVYSPGRADSTFLPASTFKIFNSLVALETGVVRDENDTIRWDGVQRQIAGWNSDQNMRSAIRFSTVWFYQELARRIGTERMQEFLTRTHYGNENLSGGIDRFWLDGGLRISPRQQVAFLQRLYANDLPFSLHTMETVKNIMILEQTDEYIFRGKTGWATRPEDETGWFVGYLERGKDVYFFANCIEIHTEDDIRARISITREILQDLGLMERPD
jgi:beta-lactamase class D